MAPGNARGRLPELLSSRVSEPYHARGGYNNDWLVRGGKTNGAVVSVSEPSENPKPSFLSDRRFSNSNVQKKLSEATLEALQRGGPDGKPFEFLSKVQDSTMDTLLTGMDVFVKSKTGSGKTMAFLVPAIERAYSRLKEIKSVNKQASVFRDSPPVVVIVVSPTKDLAMQTHDVAQMLLKGNPHGLSSVLLIGGTSKHSDIRSLRAKGGGVLVIATPGRLKDHMYPTDPKGDQDFRRQLGNVATVVLDEADRMLDDGFIREVERILDVLPKEGRQTVLVSATMSTKVKQLASKYMLPDPEKLVPQTHDTHPQDWKPIRVIDVTGDTKSSDDSDSANVANNDSVLRVNPSVEHSAIVVPHDGVIHAAVGAMCDHIRRRKEQGLGFKIVGFMPYVKHVILTAAILRAYTAKAGPSASCLPSKDDILEIHSQLSQEQRNRVMLRFRDSASYEAGGGQVLIGSDVIARGVDIPDVTFVLQVGITERETYVHRVGRTGRASQSGEAVMVLSEFEGDHMRRQLEGLGVRWRARDESAAVGSRVTGLDEAMGALSRTQPKLYRDAYPAWIGTYASKMPKVKKTVEKEAEMAFRGLGLLTPPEISEKTRKKMGLPPASYI